MPQPLTDAINALTTYANSVTGASDTSLSDAVATLASGYGQGGGTELIANWDFTTSMTDTINSYVATLYNGSQDSDGMHLTATNSYMAINNIKMPNSNVTYEIDVASMDRQGTANGRLFMYSTDSGLIYQNTGNWSLYQSSQGGWKQSNITDANYFSGHTIKIVYDNFCHVKIYRDNDFVIDSGTHWFDGLYRIGMQQNSYYNATITALRIYKGNTVV